MRDGVGLIVTQDIVGEAAESGEDSGVGSNARGVFAQSDVARVVGFVLDPPMFANGVGGGFRIDRPIGKIERGFQRRLPRACGGIVSRERALDLDDGGDKGLPFRPRDGELCVEHLNCAGFVAVAPVLVHGLDARQRRGGGAGDFDLQTQGRLVVFELNDQMGIGGGGGFESFFGNASRRR